jgi:hypothetical protein
MLGEQIRWILFPPDLTQVDLARSNGLLDPEGMSV